MSMELLHVLPKNVLPRKYLEAVDAVVSQPQMDGLEVALAVSFRANEFSGTGRTLEDALTFF